MALPTLKSGQVKQISLAYIHPDPEQIRQTFNQEKLQALADDIAVRKIQQPITVRKNGTDGYIVKHGERRRRAAIMAGLEKAPVILAKAERGEEADLNRLFDQYSENMLREDLNPMDMAWFYKRLRDDHGFKVAEIPQLLEERGLKKLNSKTISNYIRNTTLPEWAQDFIQQGKMTPSHGKYLFVAMKADKVFKDIEKALKKELSSEDTDIGTVQDLRRMIWKTFEYHYPNLNNTSDFDKEYATETAVFYIYKKLSDDEQKELNIVHVPTHNDGDTRPFALNVKAHERINIEYRAKWEAKKKKKETANNTVNTEIETRTGPASHRLESYFHNWLTDWIVDKISTLETDNLTELRKHFCLWLAFKCPRYINDIGDNAWVQHDDPGKGQNNATIELALNNLNHFLNHGLTEEGIFGKLFDSTLPHISFSNTCILANYLGIDIDKDYRMNMEYAEMYTKNGLYGLLDMKNHDQELLDKMKVGELRDYISERYEGTPPDIKELYESTLDEALSE